MEPILGSSVCLICFEMTEKNIFVPFDAPEKLFMNCSKYLHSTLTKGTLKDIKLHNENRVPFCKSCFDSALELTQLSEQLTTIQKDISDLTVAFSMAVFHRRSQVYSIGQSCKTSSIVEFNESCLPPNLFSMKLADQNIDVKKNNQGMDINDLHLQTDISNVKFEASDTQFDNWSENPEQSVANDIEIQFKQENLDEQCEQSTIKQSLNVAPGSEMRIVHVTGGNVSKKIADPNNGMTLTMSELLKSVKMPKIILERVNIAGHKLDVSVGNSNRTICETGQKNLGETLFKDEEFSFPSCVPKTPGDGRLLKCFYCEKTFTQEGHRTLHHQTHTGRKNERSLVKQKFVQINNQKRYQTTHRGKKAIYKCSYCEKAFSKPTYLKIHERTHTGEKPFKCSICNKRFNESGALKNHKRTHTGEKPFECSICNKRFNASGTMNTHKITHTGEKPFKCSFCSKGFARSFSLKCHERTHTGDQPFKCSFCNKRFNHQYNLKRHERTHTGERPFKCSFCNNQFKQRFHLENHERTHTGEKPFKCSFCNSRFNETGQLKSHERTHTGERPFKCSVCNNRYKESGHLKRHEKSHSREKPIQNSNQNHHQEQVSTLISQVCNDKDDSLGHVIHQKKMHSGSNELKCSFCEMTFSHIEERANHEKIHSREHEIVNENFIVGI